ncbi:MAG: glycine/sarcosine/betaine reductase selenoprotein B family protein, partial [Methyloligellaceae bacterium]
MHVEYIRITRERYEKAGFTPYRWYHSDTPPPWTPMTKPLSECRLGMLASGGTYIAGQVAFHYKDDTSLREIPKSVDVADLRFAHVTEYMLGDARIDANCLFPAEALRRLEGEGAFGALSDTLYSCMGGIYSQRRTMEGLSPAVLDAMREQQVDAVLLVPFCPVCHQSLSLIARHIEAAGLPTLVLASALDIVRAVNPPRTVFLDFPLGHTAGRPNDPDGQYAITRDALAQFDGITAAGGEVFLPYQWADDERWKAEAYAQQQDRRGSRDETPRYQTEA